MDIAAESAFASDLQVPAWRRTAIFFSVNLLDIGSFRAIAILVIATQHTVHRVLLFDPQRPWRPCQEDFHGQLG